MRFWLGSPSSLSSQPDNTVSGSRLNRMVEAVGFQGYQPKNPQACDSARRCLTMDPGSIPGASTIFANVCWRPTLTVVRSESG